MKKDLVVSIVTNEILKHTKRKFQKTDFFWRGALGLYRSLARNPFLLGLASIEPQVGDREGEIEGNAAHRNCEWEDEAVVVIENEIDCEACNKNGK